MKSSILKPVLALTILIGLLITCTELEKEILVSTGEITNIQTNSADAAGTLVDIGEGVVQHGHYYSKSSDPAKDILKTSLGNPEGTGGFISQVTGLEAGTKYYIVAYATGSKGSFFGEIKNFTTLPASLPALTTSDVTSVTLTSASSGGVISGDGGAPVTARGVCWGTAANPTIEGSKTTDGSGTGSFTSSLSELNPGTTYFARAYATSSAGTAYGDEKTFTTTAASLPVLTTVAVTEITQTTAISGGDITNDGGMQVTARGVCWNTTGSPTTADNKTSNGSGAGLFASSLGGLTQGTKYYVRAYATSSIGTAYGNELNFTTVILSVPGAPTIGTATAGNAQATVTFTAPASDGGSGITGYTVTSNPGGKTGTGTTSPITVTGLANGTAYTFTVTATNANGTGAPSAASNSVTPSASLTVPGAPTGVSAVAGDTQATITFTAPSSNGGSPITGYTVTSSPGGFTGTGSTSPITVTGLVNGIAYTFTVTATNPIGTGPASSSSNTVTPTGSLTVPGAPTGVSAVAGYEKATVTFIAPGSNGGSAITGYTVTSSPGGFTGTGSASPITVTGLVNGIIYTFTVTATNSIGTGPSSSASNSVTPSTVPGAPTIGSATKGNEQATVTFTAPASDGGSAITGYTVTSNPGGKTGTGTTISPITVTGLTNGTAYTFTVTATNINGAGPASSPSNSVTPSTVPGAPIIGTATHGNTQATVTFTAPASDGGSAITGYTVTSNPGGKTGTGTTANPITVTGLNNGTVYTFTVTASNVNGTGPASSASNSVTPSTIPGAPTIGTATKGNAQATVTFTAPASDGGSAITGYTMTSNPGGKTGTGTTVNPIIVTGLTNGTAYTFTVTATNINGTGPASSASNSVTPSTVPGAPTIGTATAGDTQASVTFSAPANNGGSAITGYTVTSNPDGKTGTGSNSPIIVTGLTNLTTYTFTVIATNINGNSASSAASNSVIPGTVTNPTTGKTWMDKNLGASQVATSPTDVASFGDLYQWGRAADGHQVRSSGTTTTLSSTDTPGHGDFILAPASPHNWRSPQNMNLWQGVISVNNPCPTSYRLPTAAEWDAERLSWSTNNAAGAFASPLKLTVAGYRYYNGSLINVGGEGSYWSSSFIMTTTRYLYFDTGSAGISDYVLSIGRSVRCIRD